LILRTFLSIAGAAAVFTIGSSAQIEQQNVRGGSGIEVVGSRWFRHVIMTPFPRASGTPLPGTATEGRSAAPLGYGGSRRVFVYEVTFRNSSGRKVDGIRWDHVFMDRWGNTVLKRFGFRETRLKIGKNKTNTYQRASSLPPSGTIDVDDLTTDAKASYVERIDIRCVLYDDGTFWKAADATIAQCNSLLPPKATRPR